MGSRKFKEKRKAGKAKLCGNEHLLGVPYESGTPSPPPHFLPLSLLETLTWNLTLYEMGKESWCVFSASGQPASVPQAWRLFLDVYSNWYFLP